VNRAWAIVLATATAGFAITMCGQFENYVCGNYSFETCVWGATGNWDQCVTTDCDTNNSWSFTYGFPGGWNDWQVQTYPNICYQDGMMGRTLPASWPFRVSDLKPTYATLRVDQMPTQGRWNCSFDIWTARTPLAGDRDRQLEIMIHINYTDDLAASSGGQATIEGHTWRIVTMRMSTWDYIAFLAAPRFDSFEGMNLTEFVRYSMEHDMADPNHYVSLFQAGFEVFWGYGSAAVGRYKIWQEDTSVKPDRLQVMAVNNAGSATKVYTVLDGTTSVPWRASGLTVNGRNVVFDMTGRILPAQSSTGVTNGVYIFPVPEM
jgi:hypothetical protein